MFTFKLSRDQYGLLLAALDEAAASTVLDQSKRIIDLINAIEAQVKTDEPVQLELPLDFGVTATVTPETFEAVVAGLEGLAAGLPVQLTRPASLTELQLGAPVLKPKRPRKSRKSVPPPPPTQHNEHGIDVTEGPDDTDYSDPICPKCGHHYRKGGTCDMCAPGPSEETVIKAAHQLGQEMLDSGLAQQVTVLGQPVTEGPDVLPTNTLAKCRAFDALRDAGLSQTVADHYSGPVASRHMTVAEAVSLSKIKLSPSKPVTEPTLGTIKLYRPGR